MNVRRLYNRCFLAVEKTLVVFLAVLICFSPLGDFFGVYKIPKAEAAQVTIDATAYGVATTSHIIAGSETVFISDQTGYKFYRSAAQTGVNNGECVYRKTTDGGSTWASPVLIDDQGTGTDCESISVWYDRWTPNDFGDYIHVATLDSGSDDIFYNRIDTANGDTRLTGSTAINTNNGSVQTSTWGTGANYQSITKGTDGTVYVSLDDATDSYVLECSTTCQTSSNWTETGTRPQDLANDYSILVPLVGGNIMIINRDISADDIRSKIWRNGAAAWDTAWTAIDANAPDNTTYDVGMAVTIASSTSAATSSLYLAYISDNATLGTDDDIRTAVFGATGWNAGTADVLTNNSKGLTNVAISRDTTTGAIYVGYTGRTTAGTPRTGNVYWKLSTNNMTSWGSESATVNSSANELYGVDLNISSNQRVYISWFDANNDDIYGDTIADLVPGVIVSANGSQIATTTASFTNTHIGGSFVFTEYASSRDVTAITISESGTIDGSTAVENIKLYYENDTTAPYDCASVSYGGSESQFGSTDTNGFSGSNGTSAFTGSSATVSTTSALCVYVVLDVNETVASTQTLNVHINNPSTDISVTNGGEVAPATSVDITGNTPILNDNLTQIRYHWRNDDNTEALATSKTAGVEDVNFSGYQRTPVRLRMEVSNEGSTTSVATQYRLEYGLSTSTCEAVTSWTDVGSSDDDINMSPSANLTDGNDTTNIAVGQGGVTNENTTFRSPNGGVKDTSSQTGNITLTETQYVELEYSITASTTAEDGNTYCFRLTDAGTPLKTYSIYPRFTISADINLTASGTQSTNLNTPSTNQYLGGKFVFTDATGAHTISSVMLTENGTVNAQTGLDNIRLKYDLDTTAPYDCSSESYAGNELQFGATNTASFSGENGTTTFSGSLIASTTATACMYVVLDVTSNASNGETIEVEISNATTDVVLVSGGTAPSVVRALGGTTTLVGAVLTQSRYHWRNDNGTQATATSQTAGVENTPITYVAQNTQVRLRMEVSNEGTITSPDTALRLEYGTKITSCSAVGTWTDVGSSGGAFDMYNSIHMTDGGNTTNIAGGVGGVTDDNVSFKASNAGLKDTSSQIATTTFTSTEFLESEFSIRQTANAAYDATYCFRLSNAGTSINAYTAYPELTTSPERDFEIQRGTANFSATSITLTAGVDYVAPSASTSAFVRITNSHHTGAGDSSTGGNQNADDVTAYISNPSNIMTSFTIARPSTAIATTTRVSWEIVEFIGTAGSDNEMIVRGQSAITFGGTSLTATGTAVTGIVDDSDVVVFITGARNPDTGVADYNTGQATSQWLASSDQPAFARGESNADAIGISYAVVEFTGINWKVQRASHTYTAAGTTETESITAVNSLSRTFIHTQKRIGTNLPGTDEFGHEVWLSSMGAVSFFLESGATSPTLQTSVAWIIENTQTSSGAMDVHRSDGFTNGGAEPLTLNVAIGTGVTLEDLTNASIFTNTRGALTTTLHPRVIAGVTLTSSSTAYQIWRSDTGAQLNYRTEVVEWPTAGLAFRQNDYRFYVDNDALDPTDPWPLGASDLGENTVLTGADEPLGDGEHIRIRLSLTVLNATLPELSQSFKLQYGERDSTCGAIDESDWFAIGAATSSAIWRGYNATGVTDGTSLSIDPPDAGDLNLTVSDVAGSYEEVNATAINPFTAEEGEDVEFDWHVQQNGANAETFYCFRMVDSSDSVLGSYSDYPQLRTSSFTAKTQNWRWYSDVNNETPTTAMALENTAPIDLGNGSTTKLRVAVKETENIARDDVRFRLQYSEYADFSVAYDVHATTTCVLSTSTWCYFNGGGSDNAVISTKVLSDADSCVAGVGDGCGTHNEGIHAATGFRHEGNATTEYEFTLISGLLRANAVYYFRLYDVVQDIPVTINTSELYPSIVAEGSSLSFVVAGLSSGTVIDGYTLDVTSTPTTIPYGTVPFDAELEAGYRLNINTNATQGYQVLMYADQQLLNQYGGAIPPILATNASPSGWGHITNGCTSSATGCFAYHPEDDGLSGVSPSRFAADDSFARLSTTTPEEVMYRSIPADEQHDIVFRIRVSEEQAAGNYDTNIVYIAVPTH